uniref:Uncharacterized protein LOC104216012 isoform X1 n=1 Tax=Nicotiana sylvestris TaxID=4096 RepID=A0A1U7VD57_NICSY|nr:PREDICTED: uncharacterized protein LOC104216012 isoform X1 [Nicotiana sylvestris]
MEEKSSCDGVHEFKLLLHVLLVYLLHRCQLFSMKHTTGFPIPTLFWSSPFSRNGKQESDFHQFTIGRSLGDFVGTNLSPIWERYLVPSEGKLP